MLFRMKSLFFSKCGNAETVAQQIARSQKTTSDQIPPAYPSEGEKLLFIGIEGDGKPDKQVVDFCSNLSPQRAKNVAFFTVTKGNMQAIETLKAVTQKAGVNVMDDVHVIKVGGLFKQSRVKQSDIEGAVAWAQKIVDSLSEKN